MSGIAKSAYETVKEHRQTRRQQQAVHPRHVACHRKVGEEYRVAGKSDEADQEPCPQKPVPSACFHGGASSGENWSAPGRLGVTRHGTAVEAWDRHYGSDPPSRIVHAGELP